MLRPDKYSELAAKSSLVKSAYTLADNGFYKLNGTAEEALRQIEERQYALPFASDPRQVFKIGVNFSSVTRNIERWLVE